MHSTLTFQIEPSFAHSDCMLLRLSDEESSAVFKRKRNNWERDITFLVSDEQKQFISAQLKTLQTGVPRTPLAGLDGTTYRLKIESDVFVSVEYCWWTELPEEWQGLKPILSIMEKLSKISEYGQS